MAGSRPHLLHMLSALVSNINFACSGRKLVADEKKIVEEPETIRPPGAASHCVSRRLMKKCEKVDNSQLDLVKVASELQPAGYRI